jgi:hypothetical protein
MSTMPAAEELSERPTILTISFVGCALLSLLLGRKALASPVFAPARSAMRAGTIAALVGLGLYSTYIYGFSKTLPQSTAPDIGEKAPLFSSTTPEGQVFSLEELRGGPILLLFYRGNW